MRIFVSFGQPREHPKFGYKYMYLYAHKYGKCYLFGK